MSRFDLSDEEFLARRRVTVLANGIDVVQIEDGDLVVVGSQLPAASCLAIAERLKNQLDEAGKPHTTVISVPGDIAVSAYGLAEGSLIVLTTTDIPSAANINDNREDIENSIRLHTGKGVTVLAVQGGTKLDSLPETAMASLGWFRHKACAILVEYPNGATSETEVPTSWARDLKVGEFWLGPVPTSSVHKHFKVASVQLGIDPIHVKLRDL